MQNKKSCLSQSSVSELSRRRAWGLTYNFMIIIYYKSADRLCFFKLIWYPNKCISHYTVTMILILLVDTVFNNKLVGQSIGVLIFLLITSFSYFNILITVSFLTCCFWELVKRQTLYLSFVYTAKEADSIQKTSVSSVSNAIISSLAICKTVTQIPTSISTFQLRCQS